MAKSKHPYSVHPGVAGVQKWIDELPEKTGRSLDQWFSLIRREAPKDEPARRDWLKTKHKLGTNTAFWLAEKAARPETLEEDSPDGYLSTAPKWVDEQYAAKKAALRPIYDKLLKLGLATGKDAKACPCKTIVPLYREHVFAQIVAPNNPRVDLGLCLTKLPDSKIPKRIIATGGRAKKDRITHRIPIDSPDQIDDFVTEWLKTAYDLDAP